MTPSPSRSFAGARPALLALAGLLATGCGGEPDERPPAPAVRIEIAPTGDARADALSFLSRLCSRPLGGELHLLVWEGYADTLFARPFERACGVEVRASYMGSSDDLVARLQAGGTDSLDLISPSSDAATAILDAGLAQPLDLARIPSYGELSDGFRRLSAARRNGAVYGVPLAFGPNPLIYDSVRVSPVPESWGVLWEPGYRGKVSLQDDIATLYMAAQYLGLDDPADPARLYNLTDEELARVKAKLLELGPGGFKLWTSAGELVGAFRSGEVALGEGWPLMTHQLRQAGFPAAETIPLEGTTAWADHWMLTRGARNLDAAYAWLEYTAQPFTHKLLFDVTAYIVASPAAKNYMTPEQAATQRDIADYGSGVNFWQWSPRRARYQEIWKEVKAGR